MLRWYEELFLRTWAGVTCCGRRQACTQTTLSKYKDTLAMPSYYCYCHLHRHHNLITITSNMWFPIYRIASLTTTRFRSLVLEPPLEPSSWWCNIFLCWSDFSIGKETTPVSAEIYETGPSFLNFPLTLPFDWWLWARKKVSKSDYNNHWPYY